MLTKEELIKQIQELEVKAEVYSTTDWLAFEAAAAKLRELDLILLDRYNTENEAFLQTKASH